MPDVLLRPIEEVESEVSLLLPAGDGTERGSGLEPLIHPDEVAGLLGVGRRTLRRLAASGELPAIKVRGSVRYRRADVARYVGVGQRDCLIEAVNTPSKVSEKP